MKLHTITSAVLISLLASSAGFAAPVINPNDSNANLVTNPTSTSTLINQQTQNLSLQWNSFNINSNESVQFVQPNTSSIAVNHINSIDVSTISGQISANGQIVLINPNGLIFSEGSKVNVGGIVASGLNINSESFLNGSAFLNHEQNSDGFA